MSEQRKGKQEYSMSNTGGQQTPGLRRAGSKGQTIIQSEKQPTNYRNH